MLKKDEKSKIINSHTSALSKIKFLRNRKRSFDRSLKKVVEYIFANEFDLFLTVTLDPRKLPYYTSHAAAGRVRTWLYRQTLRSREAGRDLRYIVFPDISEDKHLMEYHILLSGYSFSLKRSGIIIDGVLAYTVTQFKSGFTKARSVKNFSKQQIFDLVIGYLENNKKNSPNSHAYWASKSLEDGEIYQIKEDRFKAATNIDAINSLGVMDVANTPRLKDSIE